MKTCMVCGKQYEDTERHAFKCVNSKGQESESGVLVPVDEDHAEHLEQIKKGLFEGKCFCGGEIKTYGSYPTYECRCSQCDMLYDEGEI